MQARDDFEYAFLILTRIRKIENDIANPPSDTEISPERRNSEVQAGKEWFANQGKGLPTTDDKAIIGYYPLPKEPPKKQKNKQIKRGKNFPRMLATAVMQSQSNIGNCRRAWNIIPEAWGRDIVLNHTPIPDNNNQLERKEAKATLRFGEKTETITFKAFENGWYRELSSKKYRKANEKAKETEAKKQLKEKMDELYEKKRLK